MAGKFGAWEQEQFSPGRRPSQVTQVGEQATDTRTQVVVKDGLNPASMPPSPAKSPANPIRGRQPKPAEIRNLHDLRRLPATGRHPNQLRKQPLSSRVVECARPSYLGWGRVCTRGPRNQNAFKTVM